MIVKEWKELLNQFEDDYEVFINALEADFWCDYSEVKVSTKDETVDIYFE